MFTMKAVDLAGSMQNEQSVVSAVVRVASGGWKMLVAVEPIRVDTARIHLAVPASMLHSKSNCAV